MAIMDGLAGVVREGGIVVLVCVNCKIVPSQGCGVRDGRVVQVLMCPRCAHLIGEWASVEERDAELAAFAQNVPLTTYYESDLASED
jgi:hypothetical protein